MTKEEIKSKVYDCLFGKNGKYNYGQCSFTMPDFLTDQCYEKVKIGESYYDVRITDLWTPVFNECYFEVNIYLPALDTATAIIDFELRFNKGDRLPDTYEDYLDYRKLVEL